MTEILPVDDNSIERAAALLRRGEVVAFPTETVYGLGANALDAAAVSRVFHAKGRPEDNPLILHVSDKAEVLPLVRRLPDAALRLMDAFWPGPLTLVLEAADIVPRNVRAGLPTCAVRCPQHAWARKLIGRCGFPLAAPSANLSGRPSPTTARAVLEDMEGRIPLILDGGPCSVGLESTVLTVCPPVPRVLRPGGVTAAQIAGVIGPVEVDRSALRELGAGEEALSPGMRHRHYSPRAALTVVGGEPRAVAETICRLYDEAAGRGCRPAALVRAEHLPLYGGREAVAVGSAGDVRTVGAALFASLRRMDAEGRTDVFAEAVEPEGYGLAVMNRLLRAAGFNYIKV